ncbi:MAG: hypothetical protein HFE27_05835 [Clostridia bacterium]|jgi:hypothetical protein|nr:hypothetical protein [Clostridia bacterium]
MKKFQNAAFAMTLFMATAFGAVLTGCNNGDTPPPFLTTHFTMLRNGNL